MTALASVDAKIDRAVRRRIVVNLLDEIRTDLMSETTTLPNTLRKARVLAHELESQELRDWVSNELGGYPMGAVVPSYRQFSLPFYGTFHGPFGQRMTGQAIPTDNLPEEAKDFLNSLHVAEGIAALGALIESGDKLHRRPLPVGITLSLRSFVQMTGDMVLTETYHQIPRYIFTGILDNVRNRLLDFVLDLQEKEVTAERLNNGDADRETVRNAVTVNIYGNNNVVATGENVHQEFSIIHEGDVDSLIDYLRAQNVSDEDLDELKDALAAEPNAMPNAWIEKMTTKALRGAWQAGVANARSMLEQAIQKLWGS